MHIRSIQTSLVAFAIIALAAPATLAFTVENKDADGPYSVPKFNLEEQAKQFRKGDTNSLAPSLGKTASSEELVAWCRKNLAGYKVPRTIVFAEIPKTSTGKIQKFKLREMAKAV